MPGLVSVFISADMDFKIKRVIEMYGCDEVKAKDIINKTNKNVQAIIIFIPIRSGRIQEAIICASTAVLSV